MKDMGVYVKFPVYWNLPFVLIAQNFPFVLPVYRNFPFVLVTCTRNFAFVLVTRNFPFILVTLNTCDFQTQILLRYRLTSESTGGSREGFLGFKSLPSFFMLNATWCSAVCKYIYIFNCISNPTILPTLDSPLERIKYGHYQHEYGCQIECKFIMDDSCPLKTTAWAYINSSWCTICHSFISS